MSTESHLMATKKHKITTKTGGYNQEIKRATKIYENNQMRLKETVAAKQPHRQKTTKIGTKNDYKEKKKRT